MGDAAKKVFFKLPALEPAPASDVGMLARRLLEGGDLTAFPLLLDALAEADRHDDARRLRRLFAHAAASLGGRGVFPWDWNTLTTRALEVVWWDLFGMSASLAALDEAIGPRGAKGREEAHRRLADLLRRGYGEGSLLTLPPGQPVGDTVLNVFETGTVLSPLTATEYFPNPEGCPHDPADRPDR